MLSIDEAISREREVAKEKRKEMQCKTCKLFARSDLHPLQGYCRKNKFHSIEIDSWRKVCSEYVPKEMCKCAEEHEQIAEWLEELKALREKNETLKALYDDAKKEGNNLLKHERNKALDDFVKFANTMPTVEIEDGEIRPMWLEEMAEQLKAGESE